MLPEDDVEAYLRAFERTATREAWPTDKWAGIIAPFLIGEAQKAYYDLEEVQATDYKLLKAEILARFGVTKAVRARRFSNWTYEEKTPPRTQMFDLMHLARKWLQPEHQSPTQIVETLVLDKFLRGLPRSLREWVGQGNPGTYDDMVAQVERYLAAKDFEDSPRRSPKVVVGSIPTHRKEQPQKVFGSTTRSNGSAILPAPGGPVRYSDHSNTFRRGNEPQRNSIQCFECGELGHIRARCPNTSEPMQCGLGEDPRNFCGLICMTGLVEGTQTFRVPVLLNGLQAVALADSGSAITLVSGKLVGRANLQKDKTVGVLCVHGSTVRYPTALVAVSVGARVRSVPAVVVPNLPYSLVLGRDFPDFQTILQGLSVGTATADLDEGTNDITEVFPFHDTSFCQKPPKPRKTRRERREAKHGFTRARAEALVNTPAKRSQKGVATQVTETELGVPVTHTSEEVNEAPNSGGSTSDGNDSGGGVSGNTVFGNDQASDPLLQTARSRVIEVNGVPVEGAIKSYPYFILKSDLLYRVIMEGGQEIEQLVVPSSQTRKVLDFAHSHVLGGHLGVEKTQERVLRRFFWPGVYEAVKRYCASCPECQLASPKPHLRAPLIPLPVIDVPFERIAMDIVGPLEKSARGHQYILVILDYATRYPEAVPLRKANARNIARELVQVFARVGIPKEILTDQGTPFVSRLMKELCHLLKIQALKTSVYHPQTDGLVERFNRTLKGMLRKVVNREGKDWDMLLPYLLFAIREIPQSSTRFSPFELLYGRHPRGLLDILRETWEGQGVTGTNPIQYVVGIRERMARVIPLVRQHMERAQETQSHIYNQKATARRFSQGDRVMILVPTAESKLLAHWQGPYEVLEQTGPVNYRIRQPDRRKKEQIYHVNLLKPWQDREACVSQTGHAQSGPQ
uniref:Gypsy retrotransposon integrase-like protein 1 n=1 Tax=Leptobrachium leishanense TaxID=445787 RepID=A0A8C5R7L0_9ANUR